MGQKKTHQRVGQCVFRLATLLENLLGHDWARCGAHRRPVPAHLRPEPAQRDSACRAGFARRLSGAGRRPRDAGGHAARPRRVVVRLLSVAAVGVVEAVGGARAGARRTAGSYSFEVGIFLITHLQRLCVVLTLRLGNAHARAATAGPALSFWGLDRARFGRTPRTRYMQKLAVNYDQQLQKQRGQALFTLPTKAFFCRHEK